MTYSRLDAINKALEEMQRQDDLWGEQLHSPNKWITILGEEFGEVCQAALKNDNENLIKELEQVAAVAINAAVSIVRSNS